MDDKGWKMNISKKLEVKKLGSKKSGEWQMKVGGSQSGDGGQYGGWRITNNGWRIEDEGRNLGHAWWMENKGWSVSKG